MSIGLFDSSSTRVGIASRLVSTIAAVATSVGPSSAAIVLDVVMEFPFHAQDQLRVLPLWTRPSVQPHSGESGEGPVIVQVITGVPRANELVLPHVLDRECSAFQQ